MPSHPIKPEVAAVLQRAKANPSKVSLPAEQLDRKLYLDVNKTLERLGGKWSRKERAHVFPHYVDAAAALVAALDDGFTEPWQPGYFPTPPALIHRMIGWAKIEAEHRVLEPSAGQGAIADELNKCVFSDQIMLVEIDPHFCEILREKGYPHVMNADFMKLPVIEKVLFDRVVMNPPFEQKKEIDHVEHALEFLKPGGRLVSIMSSAITFREDRKTKDLRDKINRFGGSIRDNPPDSFKSSGTAINTVTVVVDRPA